MLQWLQPPAISPAAVPASQGTRQVGVRPPFFGTPQLAEQAPQAGFPELGLCSSEAKGRVRNSTVTHCLDLGAP